MTSAWGEGWWGRVLLLNTPWKTLSSPCMHSMLELKLSFVSPQRDKAQNEKFWSHALMTMFGSDLIMNWLLFIFVLKCGWTLICFVVLIMLEFKYLWERKLDAGKNYHSCDLKYWRLLSLWAFACFPTWCLYLLPFAILPF